MGAAELTGLTALELGAAIRRGEVSIPEAVRAALCAVEARNGAVNAFITVAARRALERAEKLQAGLGRAVGPLYGVPMAIKDNICTRGVKTSCASRILGEFAPAYDAGVVDRLAGAGAVSLGKLNMDEFAMGSTSETSYYGPVRNPWDLARSPGGSSGGSAAAVAAGMGWYALGSDTGGSIRQPAAFCGVTGIKPTYGTVSRYGLVAYASSMDQIGPLGRDAADCAAVLDVIQGRDARDATSLDGRYGGLLDGLTGDVRGLKVGLPRDWYGDGLDGEGQAAVLAVADVLKSRGAEVVELSVPVMDYAASAYYAIAAAEASSNLSRFDGIRYGWRAEECGGLDGLYAKTRSQGFGPEVKRRILLGALVLSAGHYEGRYQKALRARALVRDAFQAAFERCGVILAPTAPAGAPRLGEGQPEELQARPGVAYTAPANLAGLPALSMPCGLDGKGLPIGAQLIAPRFGEGALLNAAHAFQLDTDWHRRIPVGRGGGVK